MKKHWDVRGTAPVTSIMSHDLPVVRATTDVDAVTRFLLERSITCAAVSDEHGGLIGHVSMIDLVRERFLDADADSSPRATARDIMTPYVIRLPETASIDDAAALMAVENVHRVVIVSATGKAVGVVSAIDVLRWLAHKDGLASARSKRARSRSSWEYAT